MQVRAATLDDIVGIQRLYAELRPADPPLSVRQAHATLANVLATPGATIFVAELDGELVATCMLATIANFASGGRPIGLIEHFSKDKQFIIGQPVLYAADCIVRLVDGKGASISVLIRIHLP